ncbi:iron-containing alcohol dehydrogenase [Pigmentibacter sp. JX0631]|uniref:iron-containing alcohol dehydrogenase n=1 Tax=Pigmentibacter sp. JX0631 TaxID=2976982 RepID=UPI00246982C5|nr:iron-containing alcohol dehydrogenase [Pigmentibacter sp. JX0631]WGL61186.1 iron-containing alcohol dehydrogenase [Pigmentibacter sp. JX0631]
MQNFEKLIKTLRNEEIQNFKDSKIPEQYYCNNYADFKNILLKLNANYSAKKLFILSDGEFKNSSLEEPTSIDKKICDILKDDFEIIFKNLSVDAKVNPQEIHASEHYLKYIDSYINEVKCNCQIYISLGSGTITDLLKHSLYNNYKDAIFISIPTAMTVTAFTSSFSVLDIGGAKRTRQSKHIDHTIWIEPLLQAAPIALSRAGYGDLLARFVAYGDWYLGFKLGISKNYNELAFRLMDVYCDELKILAPNFANNKLSSSAVESLAPILSMAGIAMSLSGETTPLSGYEHVISHGLDFLKLTAGKELVLHGEQVALASLTSAMSFDWILSIDSFDEKKFRTLTLNEADKLVSKLLLNAPYFGINEVDKQINKNNIELAKEEFLKDYIVKNEKWNEMKELFHCFIKDFEETKNKIKSLTIRAQDLEDILVKSKLPIYPEATNPAISALEYRWAVRFSPFVRSRFSIGDFLFWIGEDPCVVAAI